MATSPIYSWPEPDNTDLVKNGALAIRTMGNAIDTTMGTMTPKSTYTAKGSIAAATAASTPANLNVGNNGETIVADSSTSTGLRYTAGNPIPNPIINSCFDIWQRGTTATIGTNTYAADRWICFRGAYAAGMTVSRQLVNDSTNLPNIQYCSRVQRDSGNTSTQGINMQYWQETSNSVILAGKTVTLSFYARAGANYSSTGSLVSAQLYTGTGTDQNGATVAYTGGVSVINTTPTLTTNWQRFTATATLATNTNEYGVLFSNTPVGTAGANDYYEITGVQIDIGSVALPVRRNGATIQGELAACCYYFKRRVITTGGGPIGTGIAVSSTQPSAVPIQVAPMRVSPTFAITGILRAYDGSTAPTISGIVSYNASVDGVLIDFTSTGLITGRPVAIIGPSSGSTFLDFSAEL